MNDTGLKESKILDKPSEQTLPIKKSSRIPYNVLAVIFWAYVLVKYFVFDFVAYLIGRFDPNFIWIIHWPLFRLSISILLLIIITKLVFHKKAKWILYILFFPIIAIVMLIVYLIKHKRWFIVSALIHFGVDFLSTFKSSTIISAVYVISLFAVFKCKDASGIFFWTALMSAIVLFICVNRIVRCVKPSTLVMAYEKANAFVISSLTKNTSPGNDYISIEDETTKEKKDKLISNLQIQVLFNRICLFCAKKLRENTNEMYTYFRLVLSIILLVFFIVCSFAICNFNLFRVIPESFKYIGEQQANGFLFLYYGIQNLVHGQLYELYPLSDFAKALQVAEYVSSFLILTLFVGTFWGVVMKKRQNETEKIIETMEYNGLQIENAIILQWKYKTLESAIQDLGQMKASLYSAIEKITSLLR